MDDREALLKGGRTGPAIVLGKPEDSLLLQRIQTDDLKKRMPKGEDDPPTREGYCEPSYMDPAGCLLA